jgi:hypothetical protein
MNYRIIRKTNVRIVKKIFGIYKFSISADATQKKENIWIRYHILYPSDAESSVVEKEGNFGAHSLSISLAVNGIFILPAGQIKMETNFCVYTNYAMMSFDDISQASSARLGLRNSP